MPAGTGLSGRKKGGKRSDRFYMLKHGGKKDTFRTLDEVNAFLEENGFKVSGLP
jgi:hypothetical protein